MEVNVIGAGLAGSEAAIQLGNRGFKVNLYEMRPITETGAHKTTDCAEFVCSNSLGAADCTNASGLLKKEMQKEYNHGRCERCGEPSANRLCKACSFLEELGCD